MKAVLMSIHPQWCEKIFSGEKTIEVRKTAPKLETPFKVYVYQTKHRGGKAIVSEVLNSAYAGGKVIGSFVCDKINRYNTSWLFGEDNLKETTCLDDSEIMDYIEYTDREFYLWHITEPKLFDKPRALQSFLKGCDDMLDPRFGCWCGYCKSPCNITRPPQSWCYVEEQE